MIHQYFVICTDFVELRTNEVYVAAPVSKTTRVGEPCEYQVVLIASDELRKKNICVTYQTLRC